jgi:ABC-type antimicrobial peptide transport system permease subunit
MLVAALIVSDSLAFGFDRAARAADLPDIIVRFAPQPAGRVTQRIAALPDIAAYTVRREVTGVTLEAASQIADNGDVELVGPGRRGYAIVAGRDVSGPGQVVVERGLADAWHLKLGGTLDIDGLARQHIVGFSQSPDNVSYPLAVPRVYLSQAGLGTPAVNLAEIWLRDPSNLNEVLVQARATSYGLHGMRFVTRTGVRVLLDQAAGIVIDLLVALSLIALATAAVMLAASARAEVQRRLRAIGVRRAVGASRTHLATVQAFEALFVAAPAATLGAAGGVLATYGPTSRLLVLLNEPAPGLALLPALIAAWLAAIAIPLAAAAWPAWRAAGRPPVGLLHGAELTRRRGHGGGPLATRRAGLTTLGARLAAARRTRLVATAATLGFSTAFVLLMLALASSLSSLETDPSALGKRYQLTADLPASAAAHVRTIPGVQAAAPRYETAAVDSFSLGETIDVVAYPGDHTRFEAPPLVAGRRLRGTHEAEVGLGLSQALGLTPGAILAVQLESGNELRLRVAGVVSSLDDDGRVAYVPAAALLAADPAAGGADQLAIRLKPGANVSAVTAALGPSATPATGAIGRGVPLVAVLRSILRAVAIVDGLVCLYALIQACALTVQERRRTVSVLRAFGAGGPAVRRLLTGAVIALVVPAALLGIALERFVLGPALARLAASYVALSLDASAIEIGVVLAGLALAGALAVVWVAHQAQRESVIAGLGGS